MTSEGFVLAGCGLALISGWPGLLLGRQRSVGQAVACVLLTAGCACGLWGTFIYLSSPVSHPLFAPSPLVGTNFSIAIDGLSACFLVPVFLVPMLGSIYGLGYWPQSEHPDNGRKLRAFYGTLTGALGVVVVAADGVTFLFAWEIMALSAFFLVATEDFDPDVRQAGWLYLASSHFATLCLFALVALLSVAAGTSQWVPLRNLGPGWSTAIFLLALAGFGTKAGIMPVHFWLPSAHAMAPSHVSAIMSGVLIKTGVYGLIRVTSLLPEPPLWWGGLLLTLGTVSGVLALAFALGQRDLKRMLAYSSIENIGIIFIGLGLALVGRAQHQVTWVVLGLGGALLHMLNHSLFKSLLFLTAGSVIHATHTRQMDRLGGLSKCMPGTAFCFAVGAVSVCGLPPLNGFISEWLIYLGLFSTLGTDANPGWAGASAAAPFLAMVGALACACFVSAYGVMFLGAPRTPAASAAHESSRWMLLPMGVLAAGCAAIGLAPSAATWLLDGAIATWLPAEGAIPKVGDAAPLAALSLVSLLFLGLTAGVAGWLRWHIRTWGATQTVTWGCGFIAPTARLQYTASSFNQMLVDLFAWAVRPRTYLRRITTLFPERASFRSEVSDVVLDSAVTPAFAWSARIFALFRYFQQGDMHVYLLYILAVVVILLVWR